MSQIVIYKGVSVTPIDRSGDKIRVQTRNPTDAAKAEIPFKTMDGGHRRLRGPGTRGRTGSRRPLVDVDPWSDHDPYRDHHRWRPGRL